MLRWQAALVISCVLAGCLGARLSEPPIPSGDLGPYSILCGTGEGWQPNPGVCSVALSGPNVTRTEPTTAVHPMDASTWIIGFNAKTPPSEDASDPVVVPDPLDVFPDPAMDDRLPCPRFGFCFHLTRDAGVTWTQFGLPPIDGGVASHDPTPVFVGDRLLIVGLYQADHDADGMPGRGGMFSIASPDFGVSWDEPQVLRNGIGPDGADRPWLRRLGDGSTVLTWMEGRNSLVAQTKDGGKSWTFAAERIPCRWPARAANAPGGFWVVCAEFEGGIYTFATRFDHELGVVSRHQWSGILATWPFVMDDGQGGFLVIGEARPSGRHFYFHVLADGSAASRVGWYSASRILAGWDWSHLLAADVDDFGAIHVLAAGGVGERCDSSIFCAAPRSREIAHFVLDAKNGGFVEERLLTPADHRSRSSDAGTTREPLQDDFATVVPLDGRMLLVWSHAWRAESAFAQP